MSMHDARGEKSNEHVQFQFYIFYPMMQQFQIRSFTHHPYNTVIGWHATFL